MILVRAIIACALLATMTTNTFVHGAAVVRVRHRDSAAIWRGALGLCTAIRQQFSAHC